MYRPTRKGDLLDLFVHLSVAVAVVSVVLLS